MSVKQMPFTESSPYAWLFTVSKTIWGFCSLVKKCFMVLMTLMKTNTLCKNECANIPKCRCYEFNKDASAKHWFTIPMLSSKKGVTFMKRFFILRSFLTYTSRMTNLLVLMISVRIFKKVKSSKVYYCSFHWNMRKSFLQVPAVEGQCCPPPKVISQACTNGSLGSGFCNSCPLVFNFPCSNTPYSTQQIIHRFSMCISTRKSKNCAADWFSRTGEPWFRDTN